MQSIEQAAKEYAENYVPTTGYDKFDAPYMTRFEHNSDVEEAFMDGAAFAQRWIQFNEKFPPRNVRILMKYKSGVIVAGYFNSTYLQLVKNVESWRPIELK